MPDISKAKILIVASDGFEESELFGPREILQDGRGREARRARPEADPGDRPRRSRQDHSP